MNGFEKGVEFFTNTKADPSIIDKITALKETLKDNTVFLAHHYQRDDIVQFADITGDSLKLAREAAKIKDKKYIVFCGVHFMAESADILTTPDRIVLMPEPMAGCPLAEMADIAEVEYVWRYLKDTVQSKIIPVTYINSTAKIKAFVGRNGGVVCTSGNASKIFDWCFNHGDKVLFLPDRYLGENTARSKGLGDNDLCMITGNKFEPDFSGCANRAKVLLWDGYCSVHRRFKVEDIMKMRTEYPGIKIIVHPECSHPVVRASDESGSTEQIIRVIQESKPGSVWAVGTEAHLIHRIGNLFPDKTVLQLGNRGYQCVTMSQTTPEKLLKVLDALKDGRIMNRIQVDAKTASEAYMALNRMLEITG
jgi:quinolinate synthase